MAALILVSQHYSACTLAGSTAQLVLLDTCGPPCNGTGGSITSTSSRPWQTRTQTRSLRHPRSMSMCSVCSESHKSDVMRGASAALCDRGRPPFLPCLAPNPYSHVRDPPLSPSLLSPALPGPPSCSSPSTPPPAASPSHATVPSSPSCSIFQPHRRCPPTCPPTNCDPRCCRGRRRQAQGVAPVVEGAGEVCGQAVGRREVHSSRKCK